MNVYYPVSEAAPHMLHSLLHAVPTMRRRMREVTSPKTDN